ncbi:monofunctional biosynthetic peptidoglycan transglycosylase [Paenirhodobacter populi]|uniref:Biosynthetic peptidoglycan transglycosylase n=1 Tax=Paenirhodobacter populi TaxID=2306993 RepID=A0A443IZS9_9RHOB|nr:monofunctional biosynthetic peptidoglycan transglycosylase [Sinirhodobacter populi]RWR11495.1 monofunctional biosynthetic peptidoglycan transglycosylase [Sinirhodobacter populi]RWR13848.1 monofunctional biosynthetic peptidoglycan transglycosylase [Sinirhodobacter populi]
MAARQKSSAKGTSSRTVATGRAAARGALAPMSWFLRKLGRFCLILAAVVLALVVLYRFVNPPTTFTMWSEGRRLGAPVDQTWTAISDIAPVMARSVVAAEDANFCRHWGFDMVAIRQAMERGGERGASTISQQVVKNVFLWQGRSWPRKAIEAALTPAVEFIWSKERILEVYLNIAEFGEGVFGVNAAAFHYFRTTPDALTARQAALLAAVLPDPKRRSPAKPSNFVDRRARSIQDGAATIRADGRAACFAPK